MRFIIGLLLLASCATPYQPNGFLGGFSEIKLAENLYHISFRGNGYTSRETVLKNLLKRAAEITLMNGYSHFIILNKDAGDRTEVSLVYHNNEPSLVNKHSNNIHIKMLNNPSSELVALEAETIFGSNPYRTPADTNK